MDNYLFHGKLVDVDEAVANLIALEEERQKRRLIMIASESFAPESIRESLGSVFQNVYAEGYPDDATRKMSEAEILDLNYSLGNFRRNSDPRYYKGVEYVDVLEALARRRCAEVFANDRVSADKIQVNVQPLSGAPANNAAYHIINPGDTVLAMDLLHGGHLSHGAKFNVSGKYFNSITYGLDDETQQINYDKLREMALQYKPKMLLVGASAYPRIIDFKRCREIADEIGAYLMVDMAHIAGLVAAGLHPSPVPYADVVTSTTHKTLRGPRGGLILCKEQYAKQIDKAVFPGTQGGPLMHIIAAKAVALGEALTPEFAEYQRQIVKNAAVLAGELLKRGVKLVSGGTDNHLMLLDLRSTPVTGRELEIMLDAVHITANKNSIPNDPLGPTVTSGLRVGTPAVTSRGMKEPEMKKIAGWLADCVFEFQFAYGFAENVRHRA